MKKKNNNTPPSSYRLPKETLEKIERVAKRRGCSKTEVIISAISSCDVIDTLEQYLNNK